ncbi:MAG: aspartate aminotransferase family protein [Sinobacteraceae bacterium]|nr:aspartate aminotransferase family protein [Nevskiaceae bacterium]MCP5359684.1 aspartate aminotransferase family protein [Nevskiaceae bacterium]
MSRDTAAWRALDSAHYLHPFTDHKGLAAKGARIVTRAEGVWLEDSDGNRLLDGMAGLWCVALGYGRRELAEAAYRQMLELPYYNSFFQSATPPAIELAGVLAELTPPQFRYAFLTGSGSEANDTLVRLVRRYWALRGEPQRDVIISRWNGYHGSTMAGASLGGMKPMHAQGGLPIPGIVHIGQPYWFECGGDLDPQEFGLRAARELEAKILELGPSRVAAFIGEPVQGAGGVVIPPESYWPEIQRIVDRYGILLASDEVICGFGRTGSWFGCEHFGTRPDFMTLAKAITSGYQPLGALMIADRVAEVLIEKGGELAHGFTYSGHPVACAVALENLRLLRAERVVERVHDELAPYWAGRWRELAAHPLVGEARCLGLFGAIELVPRKPSRQFFASRGEIGLRCRELCLRNGLVMRAVWDTMIVAPPLVISRDEIDLLLSRAVRSLDELHQQLRHEGLV